MTTIDLLKKTRAAWGSIRSASTEEKDRLLLAMAESLEVSAGDILRDNQKDLDAARGTISDVMLDRLALSEDRIRAMAQGIREAAALPDHVGRALAQFTRPNGMTITKRQVPLGLVAIIYESRPNVTSDAAALCIKSGNVCMLRSGKEAYRSSRAIVTALKAGIEAAGGDPNIVNIVEDTTHASAQALMTADGLVDLLIPRGGKGLIRACVENATVPCIETGTGICHVYVDQDADLDMAVKIIVNAKTSRPSVCNAEEVCLVHRALAQDFLPKLKPALVKAACDRAHALGMIVAAHVESPEGVMTALQNGVDSIEHGAQPSDEMLALFKERGAFQISTISPALPYALFERSISHATYEQQENGKIVFDGIVALARANLAAGVPVGLGTDVGCPYITHYDMWRELHYFVKYCGVTPAFALYSATQLNARLAGIGDATGSIEKGKQADLIVCAGDPLKDLSALRTLDMVVRGGYRIDRPQIKKMPEVERELDKFL